MDNYVRWNVPNWITITIIAFTSFALWGFVGQYVRSAIGAGPTQ